MNICAQTLRVGLCSALLALAGACGDGSGGGPTATSASPVQSADFVVQPLGNTVYQGGTLQFTTRVVSSGASGASGTGVDWSVQEGSVGGSITADGAYTAPLNVGTYHVVARSRANPGVVSTAIVQVPAAKINVYGSQAVVLATSAIWSLWLSASVGGDDAVDWSVLEGSPGGSLSEVRTSQGYSSAKYRAPGTAGTYHVVVRLRAYPTLSTTFTLDVVDHGFRPAAAASAQEQRFGHTATLLADGRILDAGGEGPLVDGKLCESEYDGQCALASASLFNPPTGTFSETGSMRDAHAFHTATRLLDGRVLVVGGLKGTGTYAMGIAVSSAELYDPRTGTFTSTGSMSAPRYDHVATLLRDGRVLITGGVLDARTASAELYDPRTGTFVAAGPMTAARSGHTATLLADGRVLVAGGGDTAELYDPVSNTFTAAGKLSVYRSQHSATLLADGSVLILGGWRTNPALSVPPGSSGDIYHPASGQFTPLEGLQAFHTGHAAALLGNGKVLVADTTAELYDPVAGNSVRVGSMENGRFRTEVIQLPDGRVVITGGSGPLAAEVYQ